MFFFVSCILCFVCCLRTVDFWSGGGFFVVRRFSLLRRSSSCFKIVVRRFSFDVRRPLFVICLHLRIIGGNSRLLVFCLLSFVSRHSCLVNRRSSFAVRHPAFRRLLSVVRLWSSSRFESSFRVLFRVLQAFTPTLTRLSSLIVRLVCPQYLIVIALVFLSFLLVSCLLSFAFLFYSLTLSFRRSYTLLSL